MVLALRGAKLQPVVGGARLGAAIPAGIAALIGLIAIAGFKSKMGDVPRDNPFAEAMSASVQIGLGIYVVIAAGVAILVHRDDRLRSTRFLSVLLLGAFEDNLGSLCRAGRIETNSLPIR